MNFKQVEAFRAVMLSGSMTAAAESLHTSQPNISRLIAQLERGSGFKLFERVGGRLLPTDEGAALFADVERAFIGLQSLERSAQNIRRGGTGQLRIAAVPSLSLTLLPEVIRRFREENPDAAISIHTNDSPMVAHWAASQFCHVGLASYVGDDMPGVRTRKICDVPGVCVFPKGHRLAALTTVRPEDVYGEEFISLSQNDGARARVDRVFADEKEYRKLNLETPYAATVCSLVALGLGVSIVSPMVAREYLHLGVETRPFEPQIRFSTYLLLPEDRPQSLLSQRFSVLIEHMLTEASKAWEV
ncbi:MULTISPECIES: LysR substrate-binding domain-containing protein [unclassified Pseudomonas]|uniref:LysR substrate-binding domain-containing protein n=1 Tax=unclassified Pseudomonas TaxID=196821 RepID=UPI000D39E30A|nr:MULTISPECIES: LysR substrate-binding domain-containing protein [unclassified Pseudomonas]RAU48045.1 LysR family transcriptional regulator [Pseudomonas sp. RIT 409]RAU55260.1 LysR family transcriptional regulator [Pseudomonas sp. RIT 412]